MDQEVKNMPQGLDMLVGENGVLLSGGQRQRILISRMVLYHPSLYIIDNATSALDALTEKKVYENLKKIIENEDAAAIVINDRETMLPLADGILTLTNL